MADIIGAAKVVISADLGPLQKDLEAAKRLVQQTQGAARAAAGGGARGGARSALNADVTLTTRLLGLQDRLNRLRTQGTQDVTRLQQRLSRVQNLTVNGDFPEGRIRREIDLLNRRIRATEVIANNERRIAAARAAAARTDFAEGRRIGRLNSVPVRGSVGIAGSPAAVAAAAAEQARFDAEARRERQLTRRERLDEVRRANRLRTQRQGAVASAAIGGFFPLLFGQGVGAAIGGAVGGGIGPRFLGGAGGFAGGVAGTFVGAQFDAAIQRLNSLGQALSDPVKNFKALQDAALLSSRSIERNVESLIAAGRAEEAAAVARADLARLGVGPEIQNLITAQDELKRTYAELSVGVATFTAGPLALLLRAINGSLRGARGAGPAIAGALGAGLNPIGTGLASIGRLANPAANDRNAAQNAAAEERRLLELEKVRFGIRTRNEALNKAEARAAIANSQGYRRLALERENEASVLREANRLRDPSIQGAERLPQRLEIVREEQALRRKNALDIQRIERDAAREQRATDRDNADRLATSRDELRLAERLRGSRGASRAILEEQNKIIGAGLARQRAFERLRAAESDPSLTANDLSKLRTDFRIAGDELSKQVVLSGDALREAARDAAKTLRDARLSAAQAELGVRGANTSLASLRSGDNSIAQFLDPFQQNTFLSNTLRNLLPTFDRNFSSFNASASAAGVGNLAGTGAAFLRDRVNNFRRGDFNDTASISSLLRDVLGFNNAVEGDVSAQQALTAATNTLLDATRTFTDAARANAEAQKSLATPLQALADKDWTVYVQPPLVQTATPGGFGL